MATFLGEWGKYRGEWMGNSTVSEAAPPFPSAWNRAVCHSFGVPPRARSCVFSRVCFLWYAGTGTDRIAGEFCPPPSTCGPCGRRWESPRIGMRRECSGWDPVTGSFGRFGWIRRGGRPGRHGGVVAAARAGRMPGSVAFALLRRARTFSLFSGTCCWWRPASWRSSRTTAGSRCACSAGCSSG